MFRNELEIDNWVIQKLNVDTKKYKVWHHCRSINQKPINTDFNKIMKSRGGKQNGILPEEFNQRGGNGGGEIDVLVTNLIKNKRTILVIEDKVGIKNHQSKMDFNECDQSKDYAVDGALFYAGALSKKFNVVALAISANSESDFLISGYRIEKNSTKINELFSNQTTIKQIDDYLEIDPYKDEIKKLSLMDDVEFQKEIDNIGKELSGQLDAVVEAEDRPGFMSIILLGLYNKRGSTKRFSQLIVDDEPDKMALCSELKDVINKRLSFMPEEKRKFALGVVDDIKQNKKADEIFIKNFAKRVMNEVLPLFEVERKFDVVGKFYQIFLKYTNQGDKKNGVVLTPHHITNLFADLVKWKDDASDTIFDPCCGSGAFVISGMRKLLDINNKNNLHKYIDHLTGKQLLGNELMPKIYGLCVANMLFHDDGKSNILNEDFFSEEFDIQYKKIKESGGREDATIGFVNPPYSGTAKNLDELTKIRNGDKKNSKSAKIREIEFFRKLCSLCSRYAVMIAPLSVFSSESDKDGRKQILQLGKLKAMIKMPDELFSETISVGTQTYICVVDLMNGKHNHEKDWVVMYDCSNDGFNKSKNKRLDTKNKWPEIKKEMLEIIDAPNYEKFKFETEEEIKKRHFIKDESKQYKILRGSKGLICKINPEDEWVLEAWMPTDYSKLNETNFEQTIIDYLKFELLNEGETNE